MGERKRLDDENEIKLAKLRNQIADENEAKKQKVLQDRKDHIDRVSRTVGAAIAGRDAKEAAELEAKIKRVQEEADRLAKEDAERRRSTHAKKVQHCVETWDKQLDERAKLNEVKKEEDAKQLAIFKKQLEDGLRADREKEEKRRKDRENQDKALIEKI